jgi:hypothetical protein
MKQFYNKKDNAAAKTVNITIINIDEIIKPAIAKPRGLLNTPINENKIPKNQRIKFPIGSQQKQKAIIDNTNPAVPIPFDLDFS